MTVPVTFEDAAAHLRLPPGPSDLDDQIELWIEDAVAWVEAYTGHILEEREVVETVDCLDRLRIRAWPIAPTATVGIAYTDGDGPQTITGARLDLSRRPARILPALGTCWPRLRAGTPIAVTVTAGYGDEDPPRNFRRAMLILISAYDSDREGGDIFVKAEAAARRLLSQYRMRSL